jgi:hypothetical protein
MNSKGQETNIENGIEQLLGRYLRSKAASIETRSANHLDQDSLNAYVEGNLTEKESPAIVRHLVGCSFCRQITVDIASLRSDFHNETEIPEPAKQPAKLSEVLAGLVSQLFGGADAAVLAHEEKAEPDTEKSGSDTKED